jgi:hypothetical protein
MIDCKTTLKDSLLKNTFKFSGTCMHIVCEKKIMLGSTLMKRFTQVIRYISDMPANE